MPVSGRRAASSVAGMGREVRVLAVDDQDVFLRACARLVAATTGFRWLGGVRSGAEALRHVDELEPDLALVDVRMPQMDGLETTRRLHEQRANLVVVLVSAEPAEDLPAALGASGAAAHVRKHTLTPTTLRRLWAAHGATRVTG
jgi:DNA-binding NarL/FixJ family response regulator